MPDITMCSSETCNVRKNCYRNPESGTKPSEFWQSWFLSVGKEDEDCIYYWPKGNRDE